MSITRRDVLAGSAALAAGFIVRGARAAHPAAATLHVKRAIERGHANHGWLDTHHSFSFADYYDPNAMGFRALRVINEDRIQGAAGFPMHPHRDMEIVTYVMHGGVQHQDSMGNGGIIVPGEIQRMSAGTGIRHSEFNASREDELHLLQIWMLPAKTGYTPSYEQKRIARGGDLRLIASPDGAQGSITIGQDVRIHAGTFTKGDGARFTIAPRRGLWLQVAKGLVTVNGTLMEGGDAAYAAEPGTVTMTAEDASEVLVFDLA